MDGPCPSGDRRCLAWRTLPAARTAFAELHDNANCNHRPCACAGTLALAQADVAQANYAAASESKILVRSADVGLATNLDVAGTSSPNPKENFMFRKYALIAVAATAALGVSMLAPTSNAQAATWACGSVGQLSCHDLPCVIGDTSSSVGGFDHCVSAIPFKEKPRNLGDRKANPDRPAVGAPATTLR